MEGVGTLEQYLFGEMEGFYDPYLTCQESRKMAFMPNRNNQRRERVLHSVRLESSARF